MPRLVATRIACALVVTTAFASCAGAPAPDAPTAPVLPLPPRAADASGGQALARRIDDLPLAEREAVVVEEILAGNVPDRLRRLVPVTTAATLRGEAHTLTLFVTPDYLAVGGDEDFLRMPIRARTAQRIADRLECVLPTRKIVDDVHRAATVRIAPRPFHPDEHDITSVRVFEASHGAIEEGRAGRHGLVSGIKKDVVVTPLLDERPGRVAIYGWHRRDGSPIQPLSTVHTDAHVDYSHGVRLVHRRALLDGTWIELPLLLADPELAPLVSDEGAHAVWRYVGGR